MREVKCQFCGKMDDKSKMDRIDDKNFHPNCGILYCDKKSLSKVICRIFDLKRPGPVNEKLIKNYYEAGYTYKGIEKALIYHYDILKSDKAKGNQRIGIVPYVYEEAEKYFKKEQEDKERVIKKVRQNLLENNGKENKVYVKYKSKERKDFRKEIELDDLEKMLSD